MSKQSLRKLLHAIVGVLIASCALPVEGGNRMVVRLDDEQGRIGEYLTGVHFVYSDEKDVIYEDDSFANWARKAGITTARFPGGTVIKYWDWRAPSGYQTVDSWDAANADRAPPSEWMSLDEYLHFVDVSGVTPLIGVNMLSGVRNGRIEDSVVRAREQVSYVVSKGHAGAFYYLGNEDIGHMGGIEEAARIFVKHAQAIKLADPSAKLFWNDNTVNKVRLRKFLQIAGDHADGVEFHGKWPYGDGRLTEKVTVADWQKHFPFSIQKRGQFSERALELRNYAAKLGYPDLMFANNEYGLSQFKQERFIGFDRYTYGLATIEYLQDLFIGRFDMAAFWSNVAAGRSSGGERSERRLIDTEANNRLNPVHFGLEMLSSAQGKRLIPIAGGGPDGYGFGALSNDRIEVFLLNKTSASNSVRLEIDGQTLAGNAGLMLSLVDTSDHWGRVQETRIDIDAGGVGLDLPPLSYSKITLPVGQNVDQTP